MFLLGGNDTNIIKSEVLFVASDMATENNEYEWYIEVDEIPQVIYVEGKQSKMYVNRETRKAWYEYEDKLPTPEELQKQAIENLKAQIELQQGTLDDLIMDIIPSLLLLGGEM